VFVVWAVLLAVLLSRTIYGANVRLGRQPLAAQLSGCAVDSIRTATFVISGMGPRSPDPGGFSVGSVTSNRAPGGADTIAAVVVGGTSIWVETAPCGARRRGAVFEQ